MICSPDNIPSTLYGAAQTLVDPIWGTNFVVEAAIAFADVALPVAAERVGGMISLGEKRLFRRLARDHFTGVGSIVDAGTFLGASTVALASGLVANSRGRKLVKASGSAATTSSGLRPWQPGKRRTSPVSKRPCSSATCRRARGEL